MCDSPSILADIAGALGFGAPDVESAATRSAVVGGYATEQGASRRAGYRAPPGFGSKSTRKPGAVAASLHDERLTSIHNPVLPHRPASLFDEAGERREALERF